MAVEKKWLSVPATPLTSDGTTRGVVTVADTVGFKVKGTAFLAANTLNPLQVQIQRVLSPTQMVVGPIGSTPAINNYTDVSAYTVALNAQIGFPEQDKNKIKPDDIEQAIYDADPIVADRVIFVDQYGRYYTDSNPLPIAFDGTVVIGDVHVFGRNGNTIEPNPDGSLNVKLEEDHNYGTVGSNTLRTAAQIGNATGSADFNSGASTVQTLRTTSNLKREGNDLDYNFGVSSANTLRVSALVGNATGAADFNAGITGAQTQRVSANITRNGTELSYNAGSSDANTLRTASNLKREGNDLDYNFGVVSANTLRTSALVGNATGAADFNYGTVGAQTLRTAAQIGNSTGAANFGAGVTGAQTLRVAANLYDGSANAITSEANGGLRALDVQPQNNGPVAPGTAANFSGLAGGQYSPTLPTPSTGQQTALQQDYRARLWIAPQALSYFHPIFTTRLQFVTAGNAAASTTISATLSPTTAGSLIVVVAFAANGTLTISDSASQAYSTATTQTSGTDKLQVFYFANTAAGVTSITLTSTSSTGLGLIVAEYANVATATPLDKTSTNTNPNGTTWTSNATAATVQANELLIGSAMGPAHSNDVFTPGTGWFAVATQADQVGGTNFTGFLQEQFVLATGAYASTGTTNQNDTTLASIATFKISAYPTNFVKIGTAATVKAGQGSLSKVVINTLGTGSASVTFYDGSVSPLNVIATLSLTSTMGTFEYDAKFNTSLLMVVNSTTADFTVIYD